MLFLVSNPPVRRFSYLRKALVTILLSICALLCLTLIASQIEQHIFRRRAEHLLAEIQALQLRRTPWPEALREFQAWGPEQKRGDVCNEHQCSLEITLFEPVYAFAFRSYLFQRLDDYLRWKLNLTYDTGPFARLEYALASAYMVAGGRPAKVDASVSMRDGVVWSKEFHVTIETYWHNVPDFYSGWVGYALIADTHSVPRFYRYGSENPQLLIHPEYEIGRPGGCEICVLGWAHFTPFADSRDINRLMALDLSCLTRLRPCLEQSDIMPAAWTQYLAETTRVDEMWGHSICSSSLIEMLGRDAPNVVTGKIIVHNQDVAGDRTRIRLLEKLKGATNWEVGNTYEIRIAGGANHVRDPEAQFIFFFDDTSVNREQTDRAGGCSPVPMSESNLVLVRQGISMDYSTSDKTN
jgi:hypothetical protein